MIDSDVQRLSSAELEDLAFIILSARADVDDISLYPELGDDVRARLRSRIKQLAKYNWPSSMAEDPHFRRGWSLRQCCRLAIALLMLDAHLPPSLVVQMARNNEVAFLFLIAERLATPTRTCAAPGDRIVVVIPGEIRDALSLPGWSDLEAGRVRFVRREDLPRVWADDDVGGAGSRLLIDIATAVAVLWRWIALRRLMDDTARIALLTEIESLRHEPGYALIASAGHRRDRDPKT